MSTLEGHPINRQEQIKGEHATMELQQPERMKVWLNSTKRRRDNPSDLDVAVTPGLASPLEQLSLSYWHESAPAGETEASHGFTARISFNPYEAERPFEYWRGWHKALTLDLLERLEAKDSDPSRLYSVPHEYDAFYYAIDDATLAHISFESTRDDCSVMINTLPWHELRQYFDQPATAQETPAPHPYDTLTALNNLTSSVIDSIMTEYKTDDAGDHPTISIAPPYNETLAQLAIASLIPDVEQRTRKGTDFELLGGLHGPKRELTNIADAFNDPIGAARYNIKPSYFLLHGPTGTGKTSLVTHFASMINAEVQEIQTSQVMSKWTGESGQQLSELFEQAFQKTTPYVIFFDEFDALATTANNLNSEYRQVHDLLKTYIVKAYEHPNIIIAGATNAEPDTLDSAIVRPGRMRPISVPRPNEQERVEIWGAIIAQSVIETNRPMPSSDVLYEHITQATQPPSFQLFDTNINLTILAEDSEGMTGADIKEVIQQAAHICHRHSRETGQDRSIDHQLLVYMLRQFYQR